MVSFGFLFRCSLLSLENCQRAAIRYFKGIHTFGKLLERTLGRMSGLERLLRLLGGAPVVMLGCKRRHISAATGLESVRKSHLDSLSDVCDLPLRNMLLPHPRFHNFCVLSIKILARLANRGRLINARNHRITWSVSCRNKPRPWMT